MNITIKPKMLNGTLQKTENIDYYNPFLLGSAIGNIIRVIDNENSPKPILNFISKIVSREVVFDLENNKNLITYLMILGCNGCGKVVFNGIQNINQSIICEAVNILTSLGGKIVYENNSITITGTNGLKGGTIEKINDIDLLKGLIIQGAVLDDELTIKNINNDTIKCFLNDFEYLGGKFELN